MKVSNMLDRLYSAFDDLSKKHKVFKVETIGDAWMGVTNLDNDEFDTHARQIAEFAQDAIQVAASIAIDEEDMSLGYINIRVGIHSGPVVSNVVGTVNQRFTLVGDTVNTASRIEDNSLPGRIHCTTATAELLKQQAPSIPVKLRGMIDIKGKGRMTTYWLGSENLSIDPPSDQQIVVHPMTPLSDRDDDDDDEHTEAIMDDAKPVVRSSSTEDTPWTPSTQPLSRSSSDGSSS